VDSSPEVLSPRWYQLEGIEFLISHPHCILADEMGTGKSMQAILACEKLHLNKVLIVCPNSMKYTWAGEFLKWAPEATVKVIDGPREVRSQQIETPTSYHIINYEAAYIHEARLTRVWDAIIIDEAHRVKNRKAKSTSAIRRIACDCPRVVEMTGTPIINRAAELFSLLQILFPKKYTSYWNFVHHYCEVFNNGWGWQVRDILNPEDYRVKELQNVLAGIMRRKLKSEVLPDLPEKTIQQVPVVLTETHRALYTQMKEEMAVNLVEKTIHVATIVALITRLRQMAIDPTLILPIENTQLDGAKVDALHDILESAGDEKVVVFSQFARVIHRLQYNLNAWGIDFTGFTGETPLLQREQALGDFRDNPKVRVFLTTIPAGGQGISLATASIAVFMDKAWAPAYNVQAQDRLHRMPQAHSVMIYELIARKTVEESIERLLAHKDNVTDLMVEQVRGLILERTSSN
jgi:SNF2 family DNA or RNA helicase